MNEINLIEFTSRESNADPLTELLRQGAHQLIQQAVEAELATFLTGIGAVSVQIPKVRGMRLVASQSVSARVGTISAA